MIEFGIIGKSLSHSFSKSYFEKKFTELGLSNYAYLNFELQSIDEIKNILSSHPNLKGFNVTMPYKESIISFLDELSPEAKSIGAVNCVNIFCHTERSRSAADNDKIKLIGHNTDVYGFASSIKPFLEPHHNKALILGTGGASKAVAHALKNIGVEVFYVSTGKKQERTFAYSELNQHIFNAFHLIVNTTPLGMYPNQNACPDIPYEFITAKHLCYDLIYNPETTLFLKKAKEQGATTINGLSMLQLQAEKSWEIWN